jgi:ankyrin repeat protein
MNFDNTPLLWAIANAKNKFASELLDKNIDLDINFKSNRFNNTALHLAVAKGYTNLDSDGKEVGVTNSALVKKLIAKGANPNIKTQDGQEGYTALDIAVLRCSQEMVEAILESPSLGMETIINALETFQKVQKIVEKNLLNSKGLTEVSQRRDFKMCILDDNNVPITKFVKCKDYFNDFIYASFNEQRKRNSVTMANNFETVVDLKTPKILERHISQLKHEYYKRYLQMCDIGNFKI